MRSFQLVLLLLLASFACREAPHYRKKHGRISTRAEQIFCSEREISSSGKILPITPLKQECSEHCWATVLEMIGHYYNHEAHVCELAGIIKGDKRACCALRDWCEVSFCNQPVSENVISEIMSREMLLKNRFAYRPLTENELQTELSNWRPVIVGYAGREASHVVLVIGFFFKQDNFSGTKTVYFVADPNTGLMQMNYLQILEGRGVIEPMPWEESWWRISPRADGCNQQFDPLCGCAPSQ